MASTIISNLENIKFLKVLTIVNYLDQQLFYWINSHHTTWLDGIAYWVSHRFFWLPLYGLLIYCLIQVFKKKTLPVLLTIFLLIGCCDRFSSFLLKPQIQRLRPCENPQIKNSVHVVGHYMGNYGFISSHATNSFGLAMFLWLLLRKSHGSIYLLFVWASVISYARVYGGVHYPGDVLVGSLAGLTIGWLIYKLYAYWFFMR
jgi:undecaprenyl-diphosphatase